jgi:hypothetical protein
MRRLLLFALLALALAACGSSSKPKAKASTDATTTTTAEPRARAAVVPDACKLLSAAQVRDALGTSATATKSPLNGGQGGPAYSGCTWGDLASEDAVVAVQVSTPSGPGNIDYVKDLVDAVGEPGTEVNVGENGKLLPRAFIPGGGGIGQSILFTKNGNTVVVGMVRNSEAKLKAAANAVAANMG